MPALLCCPLICLQPPTPPLSCYNSCYAGVDYNIILCPLQSRLQHIYHGQPYARVDFISHSGTLDLASEYREHERGYVSVYIQL
jgi:hypothetical protein